MPPSSRAGVAASAVGADFEIDGNQTTDATFDWQDLSVGDDNFSVVQDPIGNADTTTFETQNTSEGNYPSWQPGNPGTASGKSDIGNVLLYSDVDASFDQWLFLGFDRAGSTGTGRYYVELNQAPSSGLVPTRTEGDLRIVIGINGSDLLVCQSVDVWDGDSWASCAGYDVAVNDAPITDYFGSPNAVGGQIGANQFVELAINLTDLGIGGTCPAAGFASLHMRSQEGGENGENSAL